ncbi:MAG: hypothetical protein J0H59_16515, partial [Comamonadaceae bacterium]|nr:hypothetical protein [Comamonadaceae bacterium]
HLLSSQPEHLAPAAKPSIIAQKKLTAQQTKRRSTNFAASARLHGQQQRREVTIARVSQSFHKHERAAQVPHSHGAR